MRRPVQNKILDKFHRGFVYTCLGLTAYGGYLLGFRVYRYFTVIQPEKKIYEQQMIEHGAQSPTGKSSSDRAPQIRA